MEGIYTGYTNYFYKTKDLKKFDAPFVNEVKRIVAASGVPLGNWDGKGKPKITDTIISLNGVGEDSYESFVITAEYEKKDDFFNKGFNFCKTDRKPYDAVVKAILMSAKKHGVIDRWKFDGDDTETEYIAGKQLYDCAVGKKSV